MHTIAISGGHLTPALATIEYFQKAHPDVRLVFVGRKYMQEKEKQLANESRIAAELGIPFHQITAAKFHRAAWWRNLGEIARLVPSLFQALQILRQERVSLFLSFGGYLAVPLAVAAKILRIPVVTHEQTKTSGLANEFIANLADKVALSYADSRKNFPKEKIVVTGNPIRSSLLREYKRKPTWIPESNKPILYVTGGSQGSQVINSTVGQILPYLTERFLVIHQCGQSENQRYLHTLMAQAEILPEAQRSRYVVREWIEDKEVSWIMQHASLAVSRAGANTTQEVSLHAVPTIFIPLPFAHNNEQFKNAEALEEAGAAIILEQKNLDPDTLVETIQAASAQRAHLRRRAEKIRETYITNGAELLGELCLSLLL